MYRDQPPDSTFPMYYKRSFYAAVVGVLFVPLKWSFTSHSPANRIMVITCWSANFIYSLYIFFYGFWDYIEKAHLIKKDYKRSFSACTVVRAHKDEGTF